MKSKLNDSLVKYGSELGKLADKISPHFQPETIHKFRTLTKKMRALLRWQGKGKDHLPVAFIEIYHTTGNLRDAQVLLEGLAINKGRLPGFRLWLIDYVKDCKERWDKWYHKKIISELQHKLGDLPDQKLDIHTLELFFKKRIKKMQEIIMVPAPSDEMLHEVRKMAKDMQFVGVWCEKNWIKGTTAKYVSLQQLEKLGDQAGEYNDRCTGLQLLVAYLKNEKNKKAAGMAGTRREQQVHKRNIEKRKLILSLKRFCQQADGGVRNFKATLVRTDQAFFST